MLTMLTVTKLVTVLQVKLPVRVYHSINTSNVVHRYSVVSSEAKIRCNDSNIVMAAGSQWKQLHAAHVIITLFGGRELYGAKTQVVVECAIISLTALILRMNLICSYFKTHFGATKETSRWWQIQVFVRSKHKGSKNTAVDLWCISGLTALQH